MELGMIGLGRMGANMAQRLMRGGHGSWLRRRAEAARSLRRRRANPRDSLAALVAALPAPRALWLMVPAGEVDRRRTLDALLPLLAAGDMVIDGGNSNYKDTLRRAEDARRRRHRLRRLRHQRRRVGPREGYSLMIGGDAAAVERLRPIFETLAPAPDRGWGRVGPARRRPLHQDDPQRHRVRPDAGLCRGLLDPASTSGSSGSTCTRSPRSGATAAWCARGCSTSRRRRWRRIRRWPASRRTSTDSGEGRWTVAEAIDLDVPAPVITLSLLERLRSRDDDSFADKLLAAMRNQFGGHAIKKE